MSNPRLPAETLDHIVDLLHDAKSALRNCCLVSKSWIPRTRKHLFADIGFHTVRNLESWKETFPDPLTSPAHYAQSLSVSCTHAVTPADAEEGGWLRGFSRAVHLGLGSSASPPSRLRVSLTPLHKSSLIPYHGFSPAIRSLCMAFAFLSPETFDFIISFPLLEDLTVITYGTLPDEGSGGPDRSSAVTQPPNSPTLTGSLELSRGGIKTLTRPLLSLPGGIHFRKLILTCGREWDIPLTTALVDGCSHTLESLDVACSSDAPPRSPPVDLSKAVKLGEAVFRLQSLSVEWAAVILRTITPKHQDLRQITIYVHFDSTLTSTDADVRQTVGERFVGEWSDLDRLLVQLWESRSIPLKVISRTPNEEQGTRDCVLCLLPEITKRDWMFVVEDIKEGGSE